MQRVVVAASVATGEVVALTQMDLYADYPEWAVQQDTAVIPAYRGKGLGRWVKAHMVRALLGIGEPATADVSDALAIALCHAHARRTAGRLAAMGVPR